MFFSQGSVLTPITILQPQAGCAALPAPRSAPAPVQRVVVAEWLGLAKKPQPGAVRGLSGITECEEELQVVQWGREKEGGGVRVVHPLHHSRDVSKGHFLPGGGISRCWGILSLSVPMTRPSGGDSAGNRCSTVSVKGSIM